MATAEATKAHVQINQGIGFRLVNFAKAEQFVSEVMQEGLTSWTNKPVTYTA